MSLAQPSLEYYSILDIRRDATDSQIKAAYRKLALKWHPLKNPENKEEASEKFKQIAEAFDVLINPQTRAIFDQYGESGLKKGLSSAQTAAAGLSVQQHSQGQLPLYSFRKNPEDVFFEQFGSTSPFADFFTTGSAGANGASSGAILRDPTKDARPKVPAQEINLYVTLEELYKGCSKKVKVSRNKLTPDGQDVVVEERVLSVEVGGGWKEGTRITFTREGDEAVDCEAGDIVFILKQLPHPRFQRRGYDLVFTAQLSLLQALTGTTIEITTLDRRTLPISITDIATPRGHQVVAGEGLPIPRAASSGASAVPASGNLIVEFDLRFPEQLTLEQKEQLRKILPA